MSAAASAGHTSAEPSSASSSAEPPQYACDQKGYLVFQKGLVCHRYTLHKQLGKGTFSKVFAAKFRDDGQYYALKIIRNTEKYQVAAQTELRILEFVTNLDTAATSCCIHLQDRFDYYGHPCFVFRLYGRSLYSFMHDNHYRPFLDHHVRHFAFQIMNAIDFLHTNGIIFTDLKPENIVFVHDQPVRRQIGEHDIWIPTDTNIKLVDFGSAVFVEPHRTYNYLIQTRHYRAPEVVLGLNWSLPVDIWSVGCVLLELIHGQMVFNTHDSIDHLNQMTRMIGCMPRSVIATIPDEIWSAFFHSDGTLNLRNARVSRVQCKQLHQYFNHSKREHQLMMDLVQKMLRWKEQDRWKSNKCMAHPYFQADRGDAEPRERLAEKRVPHARSDRPRASPGRSRGSKSPRQRSPLHGQRRASPRQGSSDRRAEKRRSR